MSKKDSDEFKDLDALLAPLRATLQATDATESERAQWRRALRKQGHSLQKRKPILFGLFSPRFQNVFSLCAGLVIGILVTLLYLNVQKSGGNFSDDDATIVRTFAKAY